MDRALSPLFGDFCFSSSFSGLLLLRVLVVDCTQSISINHKPAASSSPYIQCVQYVNLALSLPLLPAQRQNSNDPPFPPSNLCRTGKSNNPALNRLCRRGFRFPFVSECLYLKLSSVTLRFSLYCQICVSVACNRHASICMAD